MADSARWRAIQGFNLYWKNWNDEYVVYNDGSGDTHLFNEFGAFILKLLIENEFTLDELVSLTDESITPCSPDDLYYQISDLLLELDRLGVIERIHK